MIDQRRLLVLSFQIIKNIRVFMTESRVLVAKSIIFCTDSRESTLWHFWNQLHQLLPELTDSPHYHYFLPRGSMRYKSSQYTHVFENACMLFPPYSITCITSKFTWLANARNNNKDHSVCPGLLTLWTTQFHPFKSDFTPYATFENNNNIRAQILAD